LYRASGTDVPALSEHFLARHGIGQKEPGVLGATPARRQLQQGLHGRIVSWHCFPAAARTVIRIIPTLPDCPTPPFLERAVDNGLGA
jgi:hypothetical protein